MNNIEILKKAIADRKQIKYSYYNETKPEERNLIRVGNPHIIFYSASENRPKDIIMVHIFEISKGESFTNDFRPFEINKLNIVEVTDSSFDISIKYKPNSYYYRNGVIYKI